MMPSATGVAQPLAFVLAASTDTDTLHPFKPRLLRRVGRAWRRADVDPRSNADLALQFLFIALMVSALSLLVGASAQSRVSRVEDYSSGRAGLFPGIGIDIVQLGHIGLARAKVGVIRETPGGFVRGACRGKFDIIIRNSEKSTIRIPLPDLYVGLN